MPPSLTVTAIAVAPASSAFSRSSLSAEDGSVDDLARGDAVDDVLGEASDGVWAPWSLPERPKPRPAPPTCGSCRARSIEVFEHADWQTGPVSAVGELQSHSSARRHTARAPNCPRVDARQNHHERIVVVLRKHRALSRVARGLILRPLSQGGGGLPAAVNPVSRIRAPADAKDVRSA